MQKLYVNGTILTMEAENDTAEAVLIEDGYIRCVGSREEVLRAAAPDAQEIDLQGKTMMPAFIDGHSHITMAMQMSQAADLTECEDFDEMIRLLRAYKEENGITSEGLISGFGYDHNFLPGGSHPVKKYLNQVSEEIPVYVSHVSGHMGCANDAALKLTGITRDTPDPEGGRIGRLENGEPDGYLEENAAILLQRAIGARASFDPVKALEKAQQLYLENGVTTVQDGASAAQTVELLKSMAQAGLLKVDVVSYPLVTDHADRIFQENPEYAGKYCRRLKLGGYKAVLDGSPQGKSAWLSKPYENSQDYCGYPWFSDEQTEEFMRRALEDGRQILVHCNGDAASEQYLNAWEKALQKSGRADGKALRPVMIHCQTVREDQLDRMKTFGMIPSLFVGHVYYWGDVHLKNLGKERAERISPSRSALDRGLKVNFHQDTPVTKPNMFHTVWCAVNRITRGGRVLGEDQCCTVYEALRAVTASAAYAYFEEDTKGTIRAGKAADLIILDKNPMEVPKEEIRKIRVLETIKDGETVMKRD